MLETVRVEAGEQVTQMIVRWRPIREGFKAAQ